MTVIMLALSLLFSPHSRAKIVTKAVEYHDGGALLEGFLAFDDSAKGRRPGVLVVHEWTGLVDYPKERAVQLARLGYVAFAADIYGKGIRPRAPDEAGKVSGGYLADRPLLRRRAAAGLAELKRQPNVDPSRTAAIGYCFGGATVLELARSGADLRGVASFHGLLSTPIPAAAGNLRARVVVFHGAEDPFVPRQQIEAFENEMRAAKADWTFVEYANAVHAFTNPHNRPPAGTPGKAEYNELADRRSWASLEDYLREWFR